MLLIVVIQNKVLHWGIYDLLGTILSICMYHCKEGCICFLSCCNKLPQTKYLITTEIQTPAVVSGVQTSEIKESTKTCS